MPEPLFTGKNARATPDTGKNARATPDTGEDARATPDTGEDARATGSTGILACGLRGIVAWVTLGLGIVATLAVLIAMRNAWWKPLPFPDPDALVWGWGKFHQENRAGVAAASFADQRAQSKSFDQLAALSVADSTETITGRPGPELVQTRVVSANFFEALGLKPVAGGTFQADDEQQPVPQVAILSESFWKKRYNGSTSVIGTAIPLAGRLVTVVGVFPDVPDLSSASIWLPLPRRAPGNASREEHSYRMLGRMKSGIEWDRAQSELNTIAYGLAQRYPETDKSWAVRLEPLEDALVKSGDGLWTLLAAAVLLLGFAAGNLVVMLYAPSRSGARFLAITESAIALALMVAAGFAIKSYLAVRQVDPGFQPAGVITANLGVPQHPNVFFPRLFQGLPTAGATSTLPLTGEPSPTWFRVEGRIYDPGLRDGEAALPIAGNYLQTIGIPLLKGRYFNAMESTPVVIVSDAFASRYFAGQDPLGKHLLMDEGKEISREIVGVVSSPGREMYVPFSQSSGPMAMSLVAKTDTATLQAAVASADPDQPAGSIRPIQEIVAASVAGPRFDCVFLCLCALASLLLAFVAIGTELTKS